MSIVHPGVALSLCGHAIRWYDNLPVLGWILLGGRCRDCRGPIAIRYPLVEAATAVMFLALGRCTFVSCSAGDYVAQCEPRRLVGGYVLALALLCTLLAAALMAYDGHQPPWRLYVPVLIAGIIAPACWPELHPVPFWSGRVRDMWTGVLDNLAVLTMVFLTVAIARVVLWLTKWTAPLPPAHRGTLVATTCVGLCLGCQSLFVLVPVAAAAYALGRLASRRIPASSGTSRPWLGWAWRRCSSCSIAGAWLRDSTTFWAWRM